jgi:ATP-dependent helicase/nuclease subunit A
LQNRLWNLAPLEQVPAVNERAEKILERLGRGYRFSDVTHLPAARSVSQLAAQTHHRTAIKLATARSISPEHPLDATEIGDATHIVMEHLDFERAAFVEDVKAQVDRMVERRFLSEAAAESVDLESVMWFVSSELGKLMRTHRPAVRQELALSFALPAKDLASDVPLDRTMIRGRIDVLIPLADRCIIIDYKTDRIRPEAIDAQVEHHRAQIVLYARAMESVLGVPVEGYLAFLTLQEWRRVNS